MEELMQKLQSVLNDEESMNQIKSLASMFGGGSDNNNPHEPEQTSDNSSQQSSSPNQSKINMEDISSLLASIAGGNNQDNNSRYGQNAQNVSSNLSDSDNHNQQNQGQMPFDIGKIMALGNVISNASKSDKNTELLLALKPHLKAEKQDKVDKVIKIFKLIAIWPAIKDSGLLGGDLFGIL